MDVIRVAEERRAALLEEIALLDRFIEMGNALLASAATSKQKTSAAVNSGEADKTPVGQASAMSDRLTGAVETPELQLPKVVSVKPAPVDKKLFQQLLAENRRRRQETTSTISTETPQGVAVSG
ncbi:MAG: hypothetical protein AAGD13_16870 [Pseudomonadota bacterium]